MEEQPIVPPVVQLVENKGKVLKKLIVFCYANGYSKIPKASFELQSIEENIPIYLNANLNPANKNEQYAKSEKIRAKKVYNLLNEDDMNNFPDDQKKQIDLAMNRAVKIANRCNQMIGEENLLSDIRLGPTLFSALPIIAGHNNDIFRISPKNIEFNQKDAQENNKKFTDITEAFVEHYLLNSLGEFGDNFIPYITQEMKNVDKEKKEYYIKLEEKGKNKRQEKLVQNLPQGKIAQAIISRWTPFANLNNAGVVSVIPNKSNPRAEEYYLCRKLNVEK